MSNDINNSIQNCLQAWQEESGSKRNMDHLAKVAQKVLEMEKHTKLKNLETA
jgi:hypothetical protein